MIKNQKLWESRITEIVYFNCKKCVIHVRWPKLDFEAHKEMKKLNKHKQQIER